MPFFQVHLLCLLSREGYFYMHRRTRHTNMQTCERAYMQSCKHTSIQTCKHACMQIMQTCKHAIMQTLELDKMAYTDIFTSPVTNHYIWVHNEIK